MSSLPRLPAELTDEIVDFFHDDEESLTNCSLVCKDWLPVTRYHIFNDLLLDRWSIEEFTNLITHPLATVAPYIHHLTIDQVKFRYHLLFHDVFRRLPQFGLLRKLELRKFSWGSYPQDVLVPFVSAFKGIQSLQLLNGTFSVDGSFQSLVTSFPSLRKLSVSCTNSIESFVGTIEDKLSANFHVLELGEQLNRPILGWLVSQRTLVDSLSVEPGILDVSSLNQYLQVLGPSLLHLTLGLGSFAYVPESSFDSVLDLSSNTRLQTLRLRNIHSYYIATSALTSTLSTIASSHMDDIEFIFCWIDPDNFPLHDTPRSERSLIWSHIDDILCDLSNLRNLRLKFHRFQEPSLIDLIKKKLSRSDGRGVLRLSHDASRSPTSFWNVIPSRNGRVNGPFCITRLQEGTT